jgi:hypothetical protein
LSTDQLLSERLNEIKNELAKIQLAAQAKGYSIDLERTLILVESTVMSLKYYEERDLSN